MATEKKKRRSKLRRIYLGGLPKKSLLAPEDLKSRFASFGKILSVEIVKSHVEGFEGESRGFAYLDIVCDKENWLKMKSSYHGKVWKEGKKLIVQEAKPDELALLKKKRNQQGQKEKPSKTSGKKAKPELAVFDEKLLKKGWKRGRYGRPVAVMHLRKLDGTICIVDPSHFKESLQKIFGTERPKPISRLSWFYEDFKSSENHDSNSLSVPSKPATFSLWDSIANVGAGFRLGLFPEGPELKGKAVDDKETVKPDDYEASAQKATDVPLEMHPDFPFASLFPQIGVSGNVMPWKDVFAEIVQNAHLYRQDYRSKHKQAVKLLRRRETLKKSKVKVHPLPHKQ